MLNVNKKVELNKILYYPGTCRVGKNYLGSMPNFRSLALSVFKCWHLMPQNLKICDPGHPFLKMILSGNVWMFRGNVSAKFEVTSFNRFGAISI